MLKNELIGDKLVVFLEGELDHLVATATKDELEEMLSKNVRELVLDLGGLTFMDSSGVGVLIGRYKTLTRSGGKMTIRNAQGHVDRILDMSGIYRIVKKA